MITFDTSQLEKGLVRITTNLQKGFDTRKATGDIANLIAGRIKVRTLQGKDRFMSPFAPYTEGTKKNRARRGRQVNKVDLSDSGQMLAAIGTRQISDTEAEVGIFDAIQQRKAVLHNFGRRVTRNKIFGKFISSYTVDYPARRFFGTSDEDTLTMRGVKKILDTEMAKTLKGADKNG